MWLEHKTMALCTVLLFSVSWSAVLHEGLGLPVISQSAADEPEPAHRQRTKRCSCNNLLDSECHYFCHLDIIWVNTPSKITVYGLGSPMARRRRSTDRCLCANPADQICNSFCLNSPENVSVLLKRLSEPMLEKSEPLKSDLQNSVNPRKVVIERQMDTARGNVVTFLRNLLRTKSRAMKMAAPDRKIAERVHTPGYR